MLRDLTNTHGFDNAAAKPSLEVVVGVEDLVDDRPETPVGVGVVTDVDELLLCTDNCKLLASAFSC